MMLAESVMAAEPISVELVNQKKLMNECSCFPEVGAVQGQRVEDARLRKDLSAAGIE